jgi:hypothetical protein
MSSKLDELVSKYAADIREKFGVTPDINLLTRVARGLGPAIYNRDAATVSGTDEKELETVKNNFLVKKLGLPDDPGLMEAIKKVMHTYGISERTKYRAVVYYMLTRHFSAEGVYN